MLSNAAYPLILGVDWIISSGASISSKNNVLEVTVPQVFTPEKQLSQSNFYPPPPIRIEDKIPIAQVKEGPIIHPKLFCPSTIVKGKMLRTNGDVKKSAVSRRCIQIVFEIQQLVS